MYINFQLLCFVLNLQRPNYNSKYSYINAQTYTYKATNDIFNIPELSDD